MAFEAMIIPDRWTRQGEAEVFGPEKNLLVWGGIPGERSVARVVHQGQHRDAGYWLESRPPSPHRQVPPCGKYRMCGGCSWMHLDVTGREQGHRKVVRESFDRVGLSDVPITAYHPSPDGVEGFRHVVKVGFGYSDQGRIRVGAWGRRTRQVVPIPECNVAHPVLRRLMKSIAFHTIDLGIRPYDAERDEGVLRAAVLRASRSTGEILVTLVAGRRPRMLNEFAERIASNPEVIGVWLHLNDDPGNAIFARDEEGVVRTRPILGKSWIQEELGEISYRIGPGDFFQTNPGMAEVLYRRTLDRLDLSDGVPFLDLYCGVGGLALPAAKRTGWALGVEGLEGAVRSAREAARRNGVSAEFMAGEVLELLPDLNKRFEGQHPVITVNPARRGLEEGVVDGLISLSPRRLGYVSCNPEALARDLVLLREKGMVVEDVELFDMFPNTHHVEALALLRPKTAAVSARRAPRRRAIRR